MCRAAGDEPGLTLGGVHVGSESVQDSGDGDRDRRGVRALGGAPGVGGPGVRRRDRQGRQARAEPRLQHVELERPQHRRRQRHHRSQRPQADRPRQQLQRCRQQRRLPGAGGQERHDRRLQLRRLQLLPGLFERDLHLKIKVDRQLVTEHDYYDLGEVDDRGDATASTARPPTASTATTAAARRSTTSRFSIRTRTAPTASTSTRTRARSAHAGQRLLATTASTPAGRRREP